MIGLTGLISDTLVLAKNKQLQAQIDVAATVQEEIDYVSQHHLRSHTP